MPRVSGFDHRPGRHCGSAALRNLAAVYNWDFDEPACFGFGTGVAVEYLATDDRPFRQFRPTPPFLERAFFENLEIPHVVRDGDDFDAAVEDVADHLADDDPVVAHLDPAALPYLPDRHAPPHTVLVVGVDEDEGTATLSDGAIPDLETVPMETLAEAWSGGPFAETHYRIVVTRARVVGARRTAATRAVRDCATYVLEPLSARRARSGPGDAGVGALRTFADDLASWDDLPDPAAAARTARASLDWHGEGRALRDLYADSLEDLAALASVGGGRPEKLRRIAAEWGTVADRLSDAAEADDPVERSAAFAEAGSVLGSVADREESFFEDLRGRL